MGYPFTDQMAASFNPDYRAIIRNRQLFLNEIKKGGPAAVADLKAQYREEPWTFIADWGWTADPRNIPRGKPVFMPFIPWPKQIEFLMWVKQRIARQERGVVDKSRDCGVTWLAVGFAVSEWLFQEGFAAGFGSRKLELVDKIGDPSTIFEKIRMMVDMIPAVFMPEGFDRRKHAVYCRLINPENGNSIVGEGGDQIGRGGRQTVYFVDEAAFVEHQESVDAALSQTTDCQIDISTTAGSGTVFNSKVDRFDGTRQKFVFDWRDDPRKGEEWYRHMVANHDPVTVAQEIDRDPNAATEGIFIPAKYVRAAIDAHVKLGFRPTGLRKTGYDIADEGNDAKAVVAMHGSVVRDADLKKDGDVTDANPWAFEFADYWRSDVLIYDGDGMGAPQMKVQLHNWGAQRMKIVAYHGSAGVIDPDKPIKRITREKQHFRQGRTAMMDDPLSEKTNDDTYLNFRAQSWTWLRNRFEATYHAVKAHDEGRIYQITEDELISIDSECRHLNQLMSELSRPKRVYSNNGKIQVESKKDMLKRGVKSPNLADALAMANSYNKPVISMMDKKPPPLPRFEDEWGNTIGVM